MKKNLLLVSALLVASVGLGVAPAGADATRKHEIGLRRSR